MDTSTLAAAMNISIPLSNKWAGALTAAMAGAQINTRLRIAAFLAQIGHESGGLFYVKELGGASYFAKYDGRKDLGNLQPGDGAKFCGRGLIQITGRDNYAKVSMALFGDYRLLKNPELLELPDWAAKSAAWFWTTRNLNNLADGGQFTDLTKKINGGLNGIEDRKARYKLALSVLK